MSAPPIAETKRAAPGRATRDTTTDTPNDKPIPTDAQAGKAVAMLLYHCGAHSVAATQAAFERHPAWVAA